MPHSAQSGQPLSYYLSENTTYNPAIPTPEAFFGTQTGEWHLRHDQIVAYMQALSEVSDRITLKEYARTYEHRALLLLTITAPENHQNIDTIQEQHLALCDPTRSGPLNIDTMPAVVYMGFSIHGNEPSGGNAAPLVAYHLAAAQSIDALLNNTVILLDPVFNPDGFSRFAHWANMHKGKHPVADPNHREHQEAWPSGRTNHYWFDLNRDWLMLQHPESRGRMEQFHAWKPNLLTDQHEMSTDRTFFFQPAIPSRNNPLTPSKNYELTAAITRYHADALNQIGALYYTKESFDDFYIGKGSTYPDINGGIGILFEQASARGHIQDTPHGPLSFPFAIRNQVRAALSTLQAAQALRKDLLTYQRDFFVNTLKDAARSSIQAYVFGSPTDGARNYHFLDLLLRHQIQVHDLAKPVAHNSTLFKPGEAYIAPVHQTQYRLLTALFEQRTTFQDSLFYDVSAWTMPLAFNLPFAELKSSPDDLIGKQIKTASFPKGQVIGPSKPYAYAFNWNGYYAPRALYRLLQADVKAKVATRPFKTAEQAFDYGAILIPTGIQQEAIPKIEQITQTIAREDGIDVYALSTGLSAQGIDLGSPSFASLSRPEILLLTGNGVSGYHAGEIWHLLDWRYDMSVSLVETDLIDRIDLAAYNTLIIPHGLYSAMDPNRSSALKTWVKNETRDALDSIRVNTLKRWVHNGGTLIALGDAAVWAVNNELVSAKFIRTRRETSISSKAYIDESADRGAQIIGGAIFQAHLDPTHPLCYGYASPTLSVFRRGTTFLEPTKSPYATPLQYTNTPLLAGYISRANLAHIKGSAATLVGSLGAGRIILFMDNPNFRAIWYGTNKLFANALFFGPTISLTSIQAKE
ncbi:MAG: M14 family zinc carboxypeptidase [bacterium]|nr:M14 family zinc carboxypeptidase [bacterium]